MAYFNFTINQNMRSKFTFCLFILIFSSACTSLVPKSSSIIKNRTSEELLELQEETAESIGLKTQIAKVEKINFSIKYNGTVKEIPNKTFFVSSPVNGKILTIFVEPNQAVKKNQKLAEITSQDVAQVQFDITKEQIDLDGEIEQAKLDLSLTESNFLRESKLFEDGITAKKDFLESDNKFKLAKSKLKILEKKKLSINELAEKRLNILGSYIVNASHNAGFVEIKSPVDGIILKRTVNPGEVVTEDQILFETSNLSEIYLESQAYQKDLPKKSLRKKVSFVTEASPHSSFYGEVNYIGQVIDPETRTFAVKAKIHNPSYKLKPGMFGKMFISTEEKEALVISKEAVQKVDNNDVVYIKTNGGYKEVKVKLGNKTDGLIEILSGLKPGEQVATKGSFWLRSELHTD